MKWLTTLSTLFNVGASLMLLEPPGPFAVSWRVQAMTDHHRLDPYAPTSQKRQILASVFWPVDPKSCSTRIVQYMPPATASLYGQQAAALGLSNTTFEDIQMQMCQVSGSTECKAITHKHLDAFPVIIFSPGSGNSRLIYSAMARSFASYGNIVVLIDHPYDAPIVEFPDGTIVYGKDYGDDEKSLEKATQIRAEDISFVASHMDEAGVFRNKLKGLSGTIDSRKIIAIGHSMGGASAAVAMRDNKAIRVGINLDGRLFEPALSRGLQRPFMQLGRPDHRKEDPTWAKFWKVLRSRKIELGVSDTVHGSFTDFSYLLGLLDLPDAVSKQAEVLVGAIDGKVLQVLLSKAITAFTKYALDGKKKDLLNVLEGFDQVSVVKS